MSRLPDGQMFLTLLGRLTGRLTLILIPWTTVFGWEALQQLVYRQKIEDVDHLKQVLNSCWDMISQQLIDGANEQWSKQLSLIVRSRGGHIEHSFS